MGKTRMALIAPPTIKRRRQGIVTATTDIFISVHRTFKRRDTEEGPERIQTACDRKQHLSNTHEEDYLLSYIQHNLHNIEDIPQLLVAVSADTHLRNSWRSKSP
ncbi:hypothetical protein AVEN_105306-1 [Araneus ventricosus]|uniref:Uncharacterized protein n=1 Tax=Araneus ventricosus TaxID=182803 RepID=A0A4Y2RJ97_ARAVE|nr:hypothetical protein AVEN_105306-1 [Araneus ventricosus]